MINVSTIESGHMATQNSQVGQNGRMLYKAKEDREEAERSMYTRLDGGGRNGVGSPTGQVRVLVLGDAGVGKSSIVHLIVNGKPLKAPERTIGCNVDVKHIAYKHPLEKALSTTSKDSYQDFFVELWDVSGNEWYKDCRSLFYSQINGIIFVHDLSQRKTKSNLQKWATEVSSLGTFSAPLPSANVCGIPVPFIVIGNKADIAPKAGGSSSNLVDVARHWVEKQGLLSPAEELPTSESFPGPQGLRASAKDGQLDLEAVNKFFLQLIRRRYFGQGMVSSLSLDDSSINSFSSIQNNNLSLNIPLSFPGDDYDVSHTTQHRATYSPRQLRAPSSPSHRQHSWINGQSMHVGSFSRTTDFDSLR